MNREEAKKELFYSLQFNNLRVDSFINKIYDEFEKQFEKEQDSNLENEIAKSIVVEGLRKENTRLKKQLASSHHIECSCSFCKPVDEA